MQELEVSTIDHYHIQRRLARGGMSEIYLANDLQSGQQVAIKLVHSSHRDDYARFCQEVQIMSTLRHKHILPVLGYGKCGDWYYLATPYIEYGTLNDRLAVRLLSPQEVGELHEQ